MDDQEISEFILNIGKKIKLISGAELNDPQEGTVLEEKWISERRMSVINLKGKHLRTEYEQTKNMETVQREGTNPCILNEDLDPVTYRGKEPDLRRSSHFLVQSFFETLQYCDEWRKFTSVSHSVIES